MKPADGELTAAELKLLTKLGLALYRNKLILDARPGVTKAQLAAVRKQVDGELPPELIALWKTSFGGQLDYDYEVNFGKFLYSASFSELFYPGSDHYHDLHGWIEQEIEMVQDMAQEQGDPPPERTPYLPFGGFEYLERFYVTLRPEEYGQVLVYARGIPWKGRLNEDSVTIVSRSVDELFDQLSLDADPFADDIGEYTSGKQMAERIREIAAKHPILAEKLQRLVQASVFDWRGVVKRTRKFPKQMPAMQAKALRCALQAVIAHSDLALLDSLHQKGAPLDQTIQGSSSVLALAMQHSALAVVERLLALEVELGTAPVLNASHCPDKLLRKLVARQVWFDEESIYSAAETGSIDGAMALVDRGFIVQTKPAREVAKQALARAKTHMADAVSVEQGKLGSYLTPEQYRQQAKLLRDFAARLKSRSKS